MEIILGAVVRCTEIDVNGHVTMGNTSNTLHGAGRSGTSVTRFPGSGSRSWERSPWW